MSPLSASSTSLERRGSTRRWTAREVERPANTRALERRLLDRSIRGQILGTGSCRGTPRWRPIDKESSSPLGDPIIRGVDGRVRHRAYRSLPAQRPVSAASRLSASTRHPRTSTRDRRGERRCAQRPGSPPPSADSRRGARRDPCTRSCWHRSRTSSPRRLSSRRFRWPQPPRHRCRATRSRPARGSPGRSSSASAAEYCL